jgi:hypothetical protein
MNSETARLIDRAIERSGSDQTYRVVVQQKTSDCGYLTRVFDRRVEAPDVATALLLANGLAAERGCICRLGPDCPTPGKCDSSSIAADERIRDRYPPAIPDCAQMGCRCPDVEIARDAQRADSASIAAWDNYQDKVALDRETGPIC